jgi:hypothetical protein
VTFLLTPRIAWSITSLTTGRCACASEFRGIEKKMTKTEIEITRHLTKDEQSVIQTIAATCFASLDKAEAEIKAWLPEFYIYRGGHHIAVHTRNGDERRVMLISEAA